MPVQVVFDDSGGENQGVFSFIGIVGEAYDWGVFSEQWNEACQSSPTIPVFKMRDAAKLSGAFRGLSEARRDAKIRQLARILNSFAFEVIQVTIESGPFVEILKKEVPPPLNTMYALGYQTAILASCYHMLETGREDQIEVVFDQQLSTGQRIKRWYPLIRQYSNPDIQRVLPVEPVFKDDAQYLPLQAADMLAWFCRRDVTGTPHSFAWLATELSGLRLSGTSQFYDAARLKALVERSKAKQGTFTAAELAAARRIVRGDD